MNHAHLYPLTYHLIVGSGQLKKLDVGEFVTPPPPIDIPADCARGIPGTNNIDVSACSLVLYIESK